MLRAGNLPLMKVRNRTATMPTASHSRALDRRSIPDCSDIGKTGDELSITLFSWVFIDMQYFRLSQIPETN